MTLKINELLLKWCIFIDIKWSWILFTNRAVWSNAANKAFASSSYNLASCEDKWIWVFTASIDSFWLTIAIILKLIDRIIFSADSQVISFDKEAIGWNSRSGFQKDDVSHDDAPDANAKGRSLFASNDCNVFIFDQRLKSNEPCIFDIIGNSSD